MARKFDVQSTATKFLSVPVTEQNENVIKNEENLLNNLEEESVAIKSGRKKNKEKNVQVSIYLTPAMAKELRLQDAEKEKETDKSAIARTGIDIALTFSNDEYLSLKQKAKNKNTTVGKIVKEALANANFFEKN